ncbi:MAG: hypothetical protein AAF085_14400 [Planctomycetota bacterium]
MNIGPFRFFVGVCLMVFGMAAFMSVGNTPFALIAVLVFALSGVVFLFKSVKTTTG